MASKPDPFRETKEFKRGRAGELEAASLLQSRGWFVIPSYDYSGDDRDKAPKMKGVSDEYILPDLDCCKGPEGEAAALRRWVEVKVKAAASWTRKTKCYEHGIPIRHYNHYVAVEKITGCAVWLCVHEEDTGAWLIASLQELSKGMRVYDGPKMSWGGMAFFRRDQFSALVGKVPELKPPSEPTL